MRVFSLKLLLFFLSIEILLRVCSYLVPYWYRQAEHDVRRNPVKYIFIGSSRVASSIVPVVFAQAMGDTNITSAAINMGTGHSTLAEHYLGLQKIAAAMPEGLKGVTVFFEAPQGVPSLESWRDSWFHPDNPYLLVNTIGFPDLQLFWMKSTSDFDQKLMVTGAMFSEAIAMQGNGKVLLARMKKNILQNRVKVAPEKVVLSASGNVRTDEAGIQNARRLALNFVKNHMKHERLINIQSSNEMIIKSLNDYINVKGGRLVLYRMPVSSVWNQYYTTSIGRENRNIANDLLTDWAIPMLNPSIKTDDDDFPDYWHLRKSRASEFTQSLAQAYTEFKKKH